MIRARLDELVRSGRATGYTLEEDAGYLQAQAPTLTYRMYTRGPESHLNLGEFAAAIADLAARMRLSRLEGVVGDGGCLLRSRQLCLTAEFASESRLTRATDLVQRRFTALPGGAPGSWRLPDVRVVGGRPPGTAAAYAHCWPGEDLSAVLLTLSPAPPLPGAQTRELRILDTWRSFLGRDRPPGVRREPVAVAS